MLTFKTEKIKVALHIKTETAAQAAPAKSITERGGIYTMGTYSPARP